MTFRLTRVGPAVTAALVLTAVLAGCSAGPPSSGPAQPGAGADRTAPAAVFPADRVDPLVDGVVQRSVKPLPAARLAPGLVPPTNRWFSGLVFGDPQPVFPLPLSFGLTEDGIAFGQPKVTTTAKTIAGGYLPEVGVDLGAASSQVSAYDSLSVTVDSLDRKGTKLGHTLIAEGSPYVAYHADQAGSLTTTVPWTRQGDLWTTTIGTVTYGLVVSDGTVTDRRIDLTSSGVATWFPVPADGSAAALAELATHPVTGGSLDYRLSGDTTTTTLTYAGNGATAFAKMPHQSEKAAGGAACDLGTYPSIYGTLALCSGQELSWTTSLVAPTSTLDAGSLTAEQKTELVEQINTDVKATPAFPADTYFGGKALYRAAMLYQLATQVGAEDAAAALKTRLVTALDQWTEPQGCSTRAERCFVYDEQAKGMVGLTPSFGSEEFNDHHFHYGYFLFAAGLVAESDPALVAKWAPVMDLLAADLASTGGNGAFPDRRVFDAYAGHSWASGTSPFADGNNQESSSEAVTAWTGLATWARTSDQVDLETEATWMVSLEAQSATTYWTNADRSQPAYEGYEHQIASLNWGGKRDYGTWFSAEPAAILGIQLIPMSPAAGYLAGDPSRIGANVAEATSGRYDQKFGDYLLMYSGLAGDAQREDALTTARTLDAQWIDDGNSRAYLLAWLMAPRS